VETSIELRYAGVVIGKVTVQGPIDESGGNSLFVSVPDPLPVGTKIGLKVDDRALEGRVIGVAESADSAKCGMKIRIGSAASAAAAAPSAPAPATESAPIDAGVSAEGSTDISVAQGDASGEGGASGGEGGASGGEDGGGSSGGQGGGRRRRRRR